MNFQNPFLNPYGIPQPFQQPAMQQAQQVVKVNGENGAKAYQIGANGSALLLDESGLMVWLVTSDGAGYKTVSAYDITPHKTEPVPDYGNLEERIKRLEGIINGNTADSAAVRGVQNISAGKANDQYDQISRKPAADAEPAYADKSADGAGYEHYKTVQRRREQGVL